EDKPVDRDRNAAAGTEKCCAIGAQVGEHLRPTPLPAQEQNHEDTSPDKAMRQNLRRRDKAQELPINGYEPPGYERRDARDKGGRFMRIARWFHRAAPISRNAAAGNRRRRQVMRQRAPARFVRAGYTLPSNRHRWCCLCRARWRYTSRESALLEW